MFNWKKKLLSREQDVKLELPDPSFIPYACHYDSHTLITKNGELLQTIKVAGFTHERVGGKIIDLRQIIRQAICEHIREPSYSLWFHTIRDKQNLDPSTGFTSQYAFDMHEAWCKKNYWKDKYVNELYITIIHEGKSTSVATSKDFFSLLYYGTLKEQHNRYFDESHARLTKKTDLILDVLEQYGAKKLGIIENQRGVFSEPLQFLGKIIHLEEHEKPLPLSDLSEYLATNRIAFGNNAVEVVGKSQKHFGAILSIKEYHEIFSEVLDNFLQLPQQFIITQTLDFINSKKALSSFKYQDYILGISGDEILRKISGMEDILKSNTGSIADYGEQQLTIMIVDENVANLDDTVKRLVDELTTLGVIAVREDLFLEDCYWSQLPANFQHICRKTPIDTARIGGLASIHTFPAGRSSGNHWGNAITLFRTTLGTPFFFNFHYEDNGHTIIVGPPKSGKTVLMNFLISEARHTNCRLFFIDQRRASRVLINTFGGQYIVTSPREEKPPHSFNPLLLSNTEENHQFLRKWLGYLVTLRGEPASDEDKIIINKAADKLFKLPREKRRLSKILDFFGDDAEENVEGSLRQRLQKWHGSGKFARLFDNDEDDFPEDVPIWGFGISQIISDPAPLLAPVMSYYMHRIRLLVDGTPTIVVIDNAWTVLDNQMFAPMLGEWMEHLKQNNAMVILASESNMEHTRTLLTKTIVEQIVTRIFLPNPDADEVYTHVFGLLDDEMAILKSLKSLNRHFMMKQGEDTIVAELNLGGFKGMLTVLSGSDDSSALMEEAKATVGDAPDKWLPVFYEKYA